MSSRAGVSYSFNPISFLKAGGHLGNPELHPSQKPLCLGKKNGLWVYDGDFLHRSLRVAYVYLRFFMSKKEPILIISQEDSLKKAISFFCSKMGFFHMQEKWMGGLLTNWSQVKKQRKNYLSVQEVYGEALEKNKDRAYLKVKARFTGIENMPKRPCLCIIMDIQENEYAFKEALKLKIPVMAFLNTDDDLKGVSFPIFGANKSLPWVRCVFELFLQWHDLDKKKGGLN